MEKYMLNNLLAEPTSSVFASDRRSEERIDVAIWSEIQTGEDVGCPLRITNISLSGLMGMSPSTLQSDILVRVKLPEIGWIEGYIMWRMIDRIGIDFRKALQPESFLKLSPYCL
jgi:PilZ domain